MKNKKNLIIQILLFLPSLLFLLFEIFVIKESITEITPKHIINMFILFLIISIPFFFVILQNRKVFKKSKKQLIFEKILIYTTIYSLLIFFTYKYTNILFLKNNIITLSLVSILLYTIAFSLQLKFSSEKAISFNKEDWVLVIPLLIFFTASFYHLGKFFSVDEYKWFHTRVPQYIEAWRTHSWEETLINDKPGILTTALSSVTFNHFNIRESIKTSNITGKAHLLTLWRLPILIFNTISMSILYFITKNISSPKSSLLFIFFISITPILIGISQIVNPDATLWICSIISILSFIEAIEKKSLPTLLISGLYLGFSFLSKYFAITTLAIIIIYPFIKFLSDHKTKSFRENLSYTIFSMTFAIFIFCIFCPEALLNPRTLYDISIASPITKSLTSILVFLLILYLYLPTIVHKIKKLDYIKIINIILSSVILALFVISLVKSLRPTSSFNLWDFFYKNSKRRNESFSKILMGSVIIQIYTNLIIITPLFILSLIKVLKNSIKNKFYPIDSVLLIAILINLVGPVFGKFVPIPRYEICIYPLIIFFVCRNLFNNGPLIKYILLIIATLLTSIDIFYTAPYYLQYTNYLGFLNPSYMTEPWGFGGYEIAEYITKNISPDEMIWSDREGVCIFIQNPCREREWNPFLTKYNFKYMVLTNTGYLRTTSSGIYTEKTKNLWEKYYFKEKPIYKRYLLPKSKLFISKIVKIDEEDKITEAY